MAAVRKKKKGGAYAGKTFTLTVKEDRARLVEVNTEVLALEAWRWKLPAGDAGEYWRSTASLAREYDKKAPWEWRWYWDRSGAPYGPCGTPRVEAGYVSVLAAPHVHAYIEGVARAALEGETWDPMLNVVGWLRREGATVTILPEVGDGEVAGKGVEAWRRSSGVLDAIAKSAFEDAVRAQEEAVRAKEEGR